MGRAASGMEIKETMGNRYREIHVFHEAWAFGSFCNQELWPVVEKDVAGVDSLKAAVFEEFNLPDRSKLLLKAGRFWQPIHAVQKLPEGELWVVVKKPESTCACQRKHVPTVVREGSPTGKDGCEGCQEPAAGQKKKTRRGTKAGRQVKERRIKATAKREAKAYAALATPAFNAPPPPPFGYLAPPITGTCSFYLPVEETSEGVATLPVGLVEPLLIREKE